MEIFKVDCYNILTIAIGIIIFHVNIISELDSSIILHIWKLNTIIFSLVVLFINSQLSLLHKIKSYNLKNKGIFFLN